MKAILAKLYAVSCDIEYLKKDKTNAFHKYRYASEEAIKKAVYPLFEKHRVIFRLREIRDVNMVPHGDSILTSCINIFEFIDVDSGESLTTEILSQGDDKNDKGAYKNHTGGLKYALTTTFGIVTGDDAETDNAKEEHPKPQTKTAAASVPDPIISQIRIDMAAAKYSPKQIEDGVAYYERSANKQHAIDYLNMKIEEKRKAASGEQPPNAV